MKLSNLLIVAGMILFTAIVTLLAFWRPSAAITHEPNEYIYKDGRVVPFRANISDCWEVPVYPSNDVLIGTITNPQVNEVYILVDPSAPPSVGTAALDIYKVLTVTYKIPSGAVFTEFSEGHSDVSNLTIDYASYNYPIIWLQHGQPENNITIDGPRIYANAKTLYDLDAVACRVGVTLLEYYG